VDVPFHVGADAHSDGDAMYHRLELGLGLKLARTRVRGLGLKLEG
jgi:hypothetical protein